MYKNSSVCTKTTDCFSAEITVLKRVHWGNTLSPTLFIIFINDITTSMTGKHSLSIKQRHSPDHLFAMCGRHSHTVSNKNWPPKQIRSIMWLLKCGGLQMNREGKKQKHKKKTQRSSSLLAQTQNLSFSSSVEMI